jgi:hypothetical protein
MSWFWMNMPLALVFFAAWCGIPLYMVLRHPSWGTQPADGVEPAAVGTQAAHEVQAAARHSITVANAAR